MLLNIPQSTGQRSGTKFHGVVVEKPRYNTQWHHEAGIIITLIL